MPRRAETSAPIWSRMANNKPETVKNIKSKLTVKNIEMKVSFNSPKKPQNFLQNRFFLLYIFVILESAAWLRVHIFEIQNVGQENREECQGAIHNTKRHTRNNNGRAGVNKTTPWSKLMQFTDCRLVCCCPRQILRFWSRDHSPPQKLHKTRPPLNRFPKEQICEQGTPPSQTSVTCDKARNDETTPAVHTCHGGVEADLVSDSVSVHVARFVRHPPAQRHR